MAKDGSKALGAQALFAGEAWFDPVEACLRGRIRGLIEELDRAGARGGAGARTLRAG
jgi:hypothetical protein